MKQYVFLPGIQSYPVHSFTWSLKDDQVPNFPSKIKVMDIFMTMTFTLTLLILSLVVFCWQLSRYLQLHLISHSTTKLLNNYSSLLGNNVEK